MQGKQYFCAALAAAFAAVGVSANYMPDISHILESHSGVVFDGEAEEFTPEAVVNRIYELKSIPLPAYDGVGDAYITAENNGYAIYSGGQRVDRYSFTDDSGQLLTASVDNGKLSFTNALGEPVTDFYMHYEHIVFDVNGDLHTSSGILKVMTDAPEEQSIEQLAAFIEEDTQAFKALDNYIYTGELDEALYSSPEELVGFINDTYLKLDSYSGFIATLSDEELKEKLSAVVSELESMTVTVNTDSLGDKGGEGDSPLNMNKLIILSSVLDNALKADGIEPDPSPDDSSTPQDGSGRETASSTAASTTKQTSGTKAKTTTTAKKTTTTTKKTTKKTTTTTAAPVQTQAPAPATTAAPRPVVTVATTTAPSYTVTEYSKKIYALHDSTFYELPSTSSTNRGSCTKYYNATCTGETSNGFYRVVVDGYTLYALKSDFSEDPQTTVVTTKAPTIKTGKLNKYTKEMLGYINDLRASYGVSPLEGIEILDSAADIRAKELKTLFDHVRPDTTEYKTVFAQVGLNYHSIGENITYGMNKTYTVKDAFENWKASQGHLSNMVNPDFKYMAIGCYSFTDSEGNDFNYWEQLFYTP